MNPTGYAWLPPLLPFDWNDYAASIERAYEAFWRDFGDAATRPSFQNRRLGLKRHPEFEGKSATFWHFVTEGADEANRTPDRARIERIAWPRALIVESSAATPRVNVWRSQRKSATRWMIALPGFDYVVVLDDRGEYLLPWTAYSIEEEHRRMRYRKEHAAWCANKKG